MYLAVVDGKDLALHGNGAALQVEGGHLNELRLLYRLAVEHARGAAGLLFLRRAGVVSLYTHGGEAVFLA